MVIRFQILISLLQSKEITKGNETLSECLQCCVLDRKKGGIQTNKMFTWVLRYFNDELNNLEKKKIELMSELSP